GHPGQRARTWRRGEAPRAPALAPRPGPAVTPRAGTAPAAEASAPGTRAHDQGSSWAVPPRGARLRGGGDDHRGGAAGGARARALQPRPDTRLAPGATEGWLDQRQARGEAPPHLLPRRRRPDQDLAVLRAADHERVVRGERTAAGRRVGPGQAAQLAGG